MSVSENTEGQEQQVLNVVAVAQSNVADYMSVVPVFTGENPDMSVNEFFDRLMEVANFADWREEQILFMAKIKVAGEAAKFVRSQPQLKCAKSLKEFKDSLIKRFQKINSSGTYLGQFMSAKQSQEEPVRSYLYRVSSLAHKCFEDEATREKMLVHQCLAGFRPEVRRFVMAQRHDTFSEIWDSALKEEECAELEKHSFPVNVAGAMANKRNSNDPSDIQELKMLFQTMMLNNEKKMSDLSEEIHKLNEKVNMRDKTNYYNGPERKSENRGHERKQYNRDIVCFNCNKAGHISRNCRNKTVKDYKKKNLN